MYGLGIHICEQHMCEHVHVNMLECIYICALTCVRIFNPM